MTDARRVRNAVARFSQVLGVCDEDRAVAFANIVKAAKYYNVTVSEANWHKLGVHLNALRFESASSAVGTGAQPLREDFGERTSREEVRREAGG